MEFPLGVFGIALATVILPNLSREYAAKTMSGFAGMLDWGAAPGRADRRAGSGGLVHARRTCAYDHLLWWPVYSR